MRIDAVELRAFRSYARAGFCFSPAVNIVCGDNGRGKTNLLEAVWLLTGARSWRAAKKSVLVRWEQERALLRGSVFSRGRAHELTLELPSSGRSRALANGVPLRRQADLSDSLRCVLFSPDDLLLVKGPASDRRELLDSALCQLRPRYAELLGRYRALLEQKSRLLRDEGQRPYAAQLLPDYDSQLAASGAQLIGYRARLCAALSERAPALHGEISGGRESLGLCYQTVSTVTDPLAAPSVVAGQLMEHLLFHRAAELAAGACLSGVHRDELLLTLDGREARAFASQGQTRSIALALKFAQRALFCEDAGEPPVLLLDDVLSELDGARRAFVARHAAGGQTILTCCEDPRQFPEANVLAL